jgi:hypothetical protein
MKNIVLSVGVCAVLLAASMARARNEDTTEYRFDDEIVAGDLLRPDSAQVSLLKKARQKSLVKIRENFVPHMLKTIEDI